MDTRKIPHCKLFGHVEIAGSSKETNYTSIPKDLSVSPTAAYLHITTNENRIEYIAIIESCLMFDLTIILEILS